MDKSCTGLENLKCCQRLDRAPHQLLRLWNPVSSDNQGRIRNSHAERECCKTQIEPTMQTAFIASRGDAYIVWNDVRSKLKNWQHHQDKSRSNESASPDEWRTHQSQLRTHCLVECTGQDHSVDQWASVWVGNFKMDESAGQTCDASIQLCQEGDHSATSNCGKSS